MDNISGSPVTLKDLMGNKDSLNWSRANIVDASSTDFNPGFNFKVFVVGTGNIEIVPADNESDSVNLGPKEKKYFNDVSSVVISAVPAFTEIPILCKAILSAGTTSSSILIGK